MPASASARSGRSIASAAAQGNQGPHSRRVSAAETARAVGSQSIVMTLARCLTTCERGLSPR
jgi:hypothetical protein